METLKLALLAESQLTSTKARERRNAFNQEGKAEDEIRHYYLLGYSDALKAVADAIPSESEFREKIRAPLE